MTSTDPKDKPVESENNLKVGANIEINVKNLDELLHNNNL